MDKLYHTIGEVAEMLEVSVSKIRFWTNSFERFLDPKRNAKGNRLYTVEDIEVLKNIRYLVVTRGLTLAGAAKELASSGAKVEARVKALDSLRDIRNQLLEIRKSL